MYKGQRMAGRRKWVAKAETPEPMQDFLRLSYDTPAAPDSPYQYKRDLHAQKRRFYHNALGIIFAHAGGQKALPRIGINPLLSSALATAIAREGSTADVPCMSDRMTHVIVDKRHPDRALIVSYDHHMAHSLKSMIERLNPKHQHDSPLAPTVDSYSDLYALNGRGQPCLSGAMVVVRNFRHLGQLTDDMLRARCNDGPLVRNMYIEIAACLASGGRTLGQGNLVGAPWTAPRAMAA